MTSGYFFAIIVFALVYAKFLLSVDESWVVQLVDAKVLLAVEALSITDNLCESSSSGRASPCQGEGSGFEPRLSLQKLYIYGALAKR